MEITLTADQEALVRAAIDSGRLTRAEDAVTEALALWESRERARIELLASLDDAEAALDRGEGLEITPESMQELVEGIHRQSLSRLVG